VSLELKRDVDGSLWAIEPTIGRTDFWVGLCIENGVNLPLIEYCHQAGRPLPPRVAVDAAVWFNEERDPFGRAWLAAPQRRGIRGRRSAFLFLHRQDPGPARAFLVQAWRHYSGAIGRRLRLRPVPPANAPAGAEAPQAICRTWHSFEALRQTIDWEGLNEKARSVFTAPDWFATLEAACPAPGAEPLLLEATDRHGSTLLAMRRRGHGRVESLSNYYAAQFDPASTDEASAVRHAPLFADWLARQRAGTLRLHPLTPDTAFWRAFTAALKQRGYWVDHYFTFGNWYHPCEGDDWARYLATRPSRLRHTIVRSRRKAAATPGFRMRVLEASATPEQVAAAVQDFKTVYARSWKKPEPYPSFIGDLCTFAHRRGWLRIGLCHLDGEPVAAQIWLVTAGVASIFKLAYDERHASRGVGTLVSAALSEHVLDIDRVAQIDFLAGDDPYKAEWMARRRERHGIVAFNPLTLTGLADAALHYGARLMRRPSRRDGWEGRPATAGDRARPRATG
jgi:CelD/BcsL family acetyltransferase involved in cellulose biosynthesis